MPFRRPAWPKGGCELFVTIGSVRAGTMKERTTRRLQWSYPPGMKVIGEYWLQADDPSIVVITPVEAEKMTATFPAMKSPQTIVEIACTPSL